MSAVAGRAVVVVVRADAGWLSHAVNDIAAAQTIAIARRARAMTTSSTTGFG
jgi:hypothetical protein